MPDQMDDDAEAGCLLDARGGNAEESFGKDCGRQPELRRRQRLTCTRSVTRRPCAATSFSLRQYRLWRAADGSL